MKTILITGAHSFIGKNLIHQLSGTYNIIPLVHHKKEKSEIEFDFSSEIGLNIDSAVTIDAIIHLAALKSGNAEKIHRVNVSGTKKVLDFAEKKNIGLVIFASTMEVYNSHESTNQRVYSEDDKVIPMSTYAATKLEAEELCINFSKKQGKRAIILRLASVFGPFFSLNSMIPNFINKLQNKQNIEIYGTGRSSWDIIYIDDVISVIKECICSNSNGIYNIGSGSCISVYEIANTVKKIFDPNNETKIIFRNDKEEDYRNFKLDVKKAKTDLSYSVEYSFEEGVKKIKEFIENENRSTL
jgi:nucleoside-diphosphate-sugar epimerase